MTDKEIMSDQLDFRMPATGEAWRHYKDGLYTIIGMARDDRGEAFVVYTEFRWALAQLPPIFTQPVGRFLQEIENNKPRFKFEREPGDDDVCPFIRACGDTAQMTQGLSEAFHAFSKVLCLPDGPSLAVQRHDQSWGAWKKLCDEFAAAERVALASTQHEG